MWPVVFKIGEAALYTYSLFISLAFFAGLFVWLKTAGQQLGAKNVVNATLLATLFGFLGARALFVATQFARFASGELSIFSPWQGGIVFFGGFIAGALALWGFCKRNKLPMAFAFDSAAPAIAAAHAVGRLGCFFNGCCYGSHCDFFWAVHYSNPLSAAPLLEALHPTQLYEVIGLILILWMLLRNLKKPIIWPFLGRRNNTSLYLMSYAVLRFLVEFTRGDLLRGVYGPFSTSQWISISLIFVALFLDWKRHKSHNSGL